MSTAWTQTPQACVSTYFTIATNLPSLPDFTTEAPSGSPGAMSLCKLLGEMLKIPTGPRGTGVTSPVRSNLKSSRQRSIVNSMYLNFQIDLFAYAVKKIES